MKPAKEWANDFLNRFPINTKQNGDVERFIEEVQKDVKYSLIQTTGEQS